MRRDTNLIGVCLKHRHMKHRLIKILKLVTELFLCGAVYVCVESSSTSLMGGGLICINE